MPRAVRCRQDDVSETGGQRSSDCRICRSRRWNEEAGRSRDRSTFSERFGAPAVAVAAAAVAVVAAAAAAAVAVAAAEVAAAEAVAVAAAESGGARGRSDRRSTPPPVRVQLAAAVKRVRLSRSTAAGSASLAPSEIRNNARADEPLIVDTQTRRERAHEGSYVLPRAFPYFFFTRRWQIESRLREFYAVAYSAETIAGSHRRRCRRCCRCRHRRRRRRR